MKGGQSKLTLRLKQSKATGRLTKAAFALDASAFVFADDRDADQRATHEIVSAESTYTGALPTRIGFA